MEQHTLPNKAKLKGTPMTLSFSSIFEMREQEALSKLQQENPCLGKLSSDTGKIGKIMVVGTAGDLDASSFENIFKGTRSKIIGAQ